MAKALYRRVLLKISGEALMGEQKMGLDPKACLTVASAIKEVHKMGVEIGLVIGGGNFFRGIQAKDFDLERIAADRVGMLATAMNGLVLQDALTSLGIESRIYSALGCDAFFEPYHTSRVLRSLEKKRVAIFVGGTGHPFFTTDTAAALRASEIRAEILLKATTVDGVYSADPKKNRKAVKYDQLTYSQALIEDLKVMDAAALSLCRDNQIPIYVFNLFAKGALVKALCELKGGSLVNGG